MGAFQRLTEGRPWGGYRSPWLCWACRPCWAWWWTPSIMSTMATQLKSCRSSLRTRRQAWLWKRWFMTELTATAGFRRLHFHRLPPVPLHHRLMRGLQQQQRQQQQPQLRILPQNIHHRLLPPPPHLLLLHRHPPLHPLPHHPLRLHPQQQRQQQQVLVKQRAQEEAQRQTQRPLQEREEEQAQQTMQQQHQFSGWRQQQARPQCSSIPPTLPPLLLRRPRELKTSQCGGDELKIFQSKMSSSLHERCFYPFHTHDIH